MNASTNPFQSATPVDAERLAFEERTVAVEVEGQRLTIKDLRTLFDKGAKRGDWKAGFTVAVFRGQEQAMAAAIEFFHGAPPMVRQINNWTMALTTAGYCC